MKACSRGRVFKGMGGSLTFTGREEGSLWESWGPRRGFLPLTLPQVPIPVIPSPKLIGGQTWTFTVTTVLQVGFRPRRQNDKAH